MTQKSSVQLEAVSTEETVPIASPVLIEDVGSAGGGDAGAADGVMA